MIAFFFVCLVTILIPIDVCGSCPHISGQASINPEGLLVYIDLNDEEVQDVAALLSVLADSDGRISVIDNGEVGVFFASESTAMIAPSIPSAVQEIPFHIETTNEWYYSMTVLSSNGIVLGPFNDVTPSTGILMPGITEDLQVEYCCRENGTVILEGCITVGTEPFEQLDGQYITIGPFYAPYQCADPYPRMCSPSLPTNIVLVEFCFTQEQTIALAESDEGAWRFFIDVTDPFCGVYAKEGGVDHLLLDPEINSRVFIGESFSGIDFFFERRLDAFNWTAPTYYSMLYIPRDTSILSVTTTVPLQGIFEDELFFTMNLPCITIGLTIVDVYVNYSTLIDGYVFNNTYEFYFHRSCTPSNSTPSMTDSTLSENLKIIIPLTVSPVLIVLAIVIIIVLVLLLVSRNKKQRVRHLEELAQHQTDNLYALATVYNPFEFLDEYHIEYNFALIDVVDKLGEGYFGNVFKARAPGLARGDYTAGEFVAVKTLKDDTNPERLQDFAKEVHVCVQFDHPNIVRLLGICTASAQTCMIFEYMDLGSLDYCLRSSNPNDEDYSPSGFSLFPDNFLPLVLQLSRAMDYLASLNFVHRDIASRNCLLDSQFTAKIADFGLSRNISAQNYYRIGGGKKNYLPIRWMPPEALLYGKFTLKSDVWSFGILMWEVYTFGLLPYTGLSNHEVIDFIKDSKVLERPDNCLMGVYDIMRSCWVRIPSQRPSMKQIMNRLELYSRGEVDPAREYVNLAPEKENYISSNN